MSQIKVSQSAQKLLRCPICHAELAQLADRFECVSDRCTSHFPIVDGVPVSIDDFTSHRQTFFKNTSTNQLRNPDRILDDRDLVKLYKGAGF